MGTTIVSETNNTYNFSHEFKQSGNWSIEDRKAYQEDVEEAADDYVTAKENYKQLMTDFQEMKLFEVFGESAPQVTLQVAIVLQVGSINAIQIFTILTSLLSLTLGASEILLMMKTKNKEIKEASWQETWILVFPVMLFVVIPRILCLSLIMAYTKEYIFLFFFIGILMALIINRSHVERDPGDAIVGILTNIFAPCIVIQEGSSFFEHSGVTFSILHSIGLLGLFVLVTLGVINVCPDTASKRYTPILHCFDMPALKKQYSQRCHFDEMFLKNCTETFTVQSMNDTVDCTEYIFSMDLSLPLTDENTSYSAGSIVICGDNPWWLPLAITCGVLVIFLILSIFLVSKVLTKMLDPISKLSMSLHCFYPTKCFGKVWTEDQMHILDPICSFMENPSRDKLDTANQILQAKTGQNLIELSIQNDYHEAMNLMFYELDEPIPITNDMIELVIKKGSPKMIDMILTAKYQTIKNVLKEERRKKWDERKHRNDLVSQWKQFLENEARAPKYDVDKDFEKHHPVIKLQLDCKMTLNDILFHCECLTLQQPLLSWLELKFDNLSLGFLWSCKNGKEWLTERLFNDSRKNGINVNVKDVDGNSGFILACRNGHINIVSFLLSHNNKVDLNARTNWGENAFYQACSNKHIDIVRLLQENSDAKNIEINATNRGGENAFIQACSLGFGELVRVLLSCKEINVNIKNSKEETGFYLAWFNDHLDIVDMIDTSPIIDFNAEFLLALSKREFALLSKLMNGSASSKTIDFNGTDLAGNTLFMLACTEGQVEIATCLLEGSESKNINLDAKNKREETPFLMGISYNLKLLT